MSITVLILYTTSWQSLADMVIPNAKMYCDKNNYTLQVLEYNEPYPSDFGFNKIIEINNLFNNSTKIVWSLDLDALITNKNIKIEDFLDDEHDFFICKDYNGINAGSFILRKSKWSENFINYILEQRNKVYCEQDAIESYLDEFPNDEKIKILNHPSINSYLYELYPEIPKQTHEQGNWEIGDFVLHLPGMNMSKRVETFTKIKPEILL